MSNYDVIVIGSGIGGLTAAGLLAKAGKTVMVLESHDRPGGYAHGFTRNRYHFDAGVHLISGCGPRGYRGGQIIHNVLRALQIDRDICFLNIDPFSQACYPDLRVGLSQSIECFVETLGGLFPSEHKGLLGLIRLCLQVAEELAVADEVMTEVGYQQAKQIMPALFKYRKATLAEAAQMFIRDPKLLALFATNWPYLGLPPSKVSFVYWSGMFIGYLADGAYYCKGGFQQFANTLVRGLRQAGGEIRYKSTVEKIVIEHGRVAGITLKGQRLSAPVVISNADIRHTVLELIPEQTFPASFIQRVQNMRHSLSMFVVYLATDIDIKTLNIGHETFCYRDFDHDRNFAQTCQGEITWLSITVPTLVDPNLAPTGQHLLLLTTLLPYDARECWKKAKSEYIGAMLKIAGRYIPGLESRILFIEGGSPSTMWRYSRNYQGAAYGFEVSPGQIGPARIPIQSPLEGLYFAGHWTSPGGGVYGVSTSGVQAAKKVLGILKNEEFWGKFPAGPTTVARTAS